MKKMITTLLFTCSMSLILMTNLVGVEKTIKNEKSFSDLTSHEKKEVIAYMLISGDCSWNGISLYGKVQIVEAFPDIKVQIVDAFPDIEVQWVDAFPDNCGQWQKVDAFPDFKIQLVDAFPDLKVQEVDAFPDMN